MSTDIRARGPRLDRFVPALTWMRGYDRTWLGPDLLAGASAAAVVIPQAMAYGTIAGLPVEVGLYTCIVPMAVYALLGGARRMSVSTTSTIVALSGVALVSAGVTGDPGEMLGAATTLTLLVGLTLWLACVLRLGFLVECVSEAVVVGLKVGVGTTIVVAQVPALLGIPGNDGGFFDDVADIVRSLDEVHRPTVIISVVTLGGLIAVRRWAPKVPGPLLAVAGGIVAVAVLGLGDDGVALVPEVPRGLPTPSLPSLDHAGALAPYAIAIGLLAYLESVSVARTVRQLDDPPLDNEQELIAVGAASVAGSFFQAVPAAGGFSQTLVNVEAGARTQLSELVTAALAVVTALALTPLLADLPSATLAAVVFLAVSGLIALDELRRLARIDRVELAVAVLTAAAAVCFNLLVGVLAGVLLTFYLVLRALNHPVVVELRRPPGTEEMLPARAGDERIPGLLVLRVEGGMYTANVRSVTDEVLRRVDECDPRPRVLVLDVSGTADTSVTVMDVFGEADRHLARHGTEMWVAALPSRALDKARRTEKWASWRDAGRLHRTVTDAVRMFSAGPRPRRQDGTP